MVIRALHWVFRLGLAAVFLYSGYVKLQAPLEFAAAVMGYQLLPATLVYPVAEYFPWLEIALGALLLSGLRIRLAGGASAALIAFFIVLLTVTYSRGIEADCGCFGLGERISPLAILRDGLLLLPALFLAAEPRVERFIAARLRSSRTEPTDERVG
jgi:uncharacterized membrane protein YphA (DoxX/SURF4 family)